MSQEKEPETIIIEKISEDNYTFEHNKSLYGGSKGDFQNIFIKDSNDYKNFVAKLGIKHPKIIQGLKTVPKGENPKISKKNIETYIAELLFQRVQENKSLYMEVTYQKR